MDQKTDLEFPSLLVCTITITKNKNKKQIKYFKERYECKICFVFTYMSYRYVTQ